MPVSDRPSVNRGNRERKAVNTPILGTFLHSSCNAEREEDRLLGMFVERAVANSMTTFPGVMFHNAHEPFLFG
jgi:hypothetical protein